MAGASLLKMPDTKTGRAAFAFEHMMAHRLLFGGMAPLDRFSVLPYLLDPMTEASKWNLNHGQAHDDALLTLPSYFGSPDVGIPGTSLMVDANLSDEGKRTWWTFTNHHEHYLASGALELELVFPFW